VVADKQGDKVLCTASSQVHRAIRHIGIRAPKATNLIIWGANPNINDQGPGRIDPPAEPDGDMSARSLRVLCPSFRKAGTSYTAPARSRTEMYASKQRAVDVTV